MGLWQRLAWSTKDANPPPPPPPRRVLGCIELQSWLGFFVCAGHPPLFLIGLVMHFQKCRGGSQKLCLLSRRTGCTLAEARAPIAESNGVSSMACVQTNCQETDQFCTLPRNTAGTPSKSRAQIAMGPVPWHLSTHQYQGTEQSRVLSRRTFHTPSELRAQSQRAMGPAQWRVCAPAALPFRMLVSPHILCIIHCEPPSLMSHPF